MIEGRGRVDIVMDGLAARREGNLLKLDVSLKNQGTVHVRPSGTYALFQQDGHLYRAAPPGSGERPRPPGPTERPDPATVRAVAVAVRSEMVR